METREIANRRLAAAGVLPCVRRWNRWIAAAIILISGVALFPSSVSAATGDPLPIDRNDWLSYINQVRRTSGLTPVSENPAWVDGLLKHFQYLDLTDPSLKTGQYASAHSENPASPYYTPEGSEAGQASNLVWGQNKSLTAREVIDFWLAGPFHAIGILRPKLKTTAFAKSNGNAGLDVGRGIDQSASLPLSPILFPGNNSVTELSRFTGESPSPMESCPGVTNPSLPLVAMLPSPPPPGVGAMLTGPNGRSQSGPSPQLCVITADSYVTSDAVYGPAGKSILQGSNAVVIIASGAFEPGQYSVALTGLPDSAIPWSFQVIKPRNYSPSPMGSFDAVSTVGGGIRVLGWAVDPNTGDSIGVHTYVDGTLTGAFTAGVSRSDIAAAFPGYGDSHGFDSVVPAGPGPHTVCTYGINTGAGDNVLLGCREITVNPDPFGSFDVASTVPGGTRVAGWVVDPDTTGLVGVHVYVDGSFVSAFDAGVSRPDVAAAFPGYGAAHGFDSLIAVAPGFHTVCAYGINLGAGANSLIGCRWVLVNHDPIGSLDVVSMSATGLHVAGWALDPDTAAITGVHVYVDGGFAAALNADESRPDVASVFPGYGHIHGFDSVIPLGAGSHTVCAYGINHYRGNNSLIGCRTT